MATQKLFTLEGKGLKLDTAQDLEAHIADLRAMNDVEEVRLLGNTLGVGACQLLGEVLATKKSLKVCCHPFDTLPFSPSASNSNMLACPHRSQTLPTSSLADY